MGACQKERGGRGGVIGKVTVKIGKLPLCWFLDLVDQFILTFCSQCPVWGKKDRIVLLSPPYGSTNTCFLQRWDSVMKYRLRYIFANFMWKAFFFFWKFDRKRLFMVSFSMISVFICVHHPCLSFQAGHLYGWSVYFLNCRHLASPFLALKWSFL